MNFLRTTNLPQLVSTRTTLTTNSHCSWVVQNKSSNLFASVDETLKIMNQLNPDWLDNAFLSDCLQNESKNKNLTVTNFKVESAVPPGNNYGSIVVRVKLNYKDESSTQTEILSKTRIIKLPLPEGTIKGHFGDSLDVEPIFYKDYLPKAYDLLNKEFAPKYYSSSSTRPVVVLEDLKECGFLMADRRENLDLDNCLRYAEAAAAFHKGSSVVFQTHPELINQLCKEKLLSNECKIAKSTKNRIKYGLDCVAKNVLKFTGDKRISRILKASSVIIWDLLTELVKPTGEFNTMNQGDPWITNMMFTYDDKGNSVAMKLLDFQSMRYASPATDLTYFLWSSAKHYVREEHYDQFIQTYLEAMNRNLEEMNCSERLSLAFLKKELLRTSPMALYLTFSGIFPLFQIPVGVDVQKVFARWEQEYSPDNNPFEEFYTEYFCKNQLIRAVNLMEKFGIFQYLDECLQSVK